MAGRVKALAHVERIKPLKPDQEAQEVATKVLNMLD